MAYIEAIVFCRLVTNANDEVVPNAISDIFDWARTQGVALPHKPLFFATYQDLTGQANTKQRILDNLAVLVARLELTVATAQQFAADSRIWTLGFWRRDDEGAVITHNWDDTLTAAQRTQARNYVTNNSNITAAQLNAAFDASDTRREIANKLKAFFRT